MLTVKIHFFHCQYVYVVLLIWHFIEQLLVALVSVVLL